MKSLFCSGFFVGGALGQFEITELCALGPQRFFHSTHTHFWRPYFTMFQGCPFLKLDTTTQMILLCLIPVRTVAMCFSKKARPLKCRWSGTTQVHRQHLWWKLGAFGNRRVKNPRHSGCGMHGSRKSIQRHKWVTFTPQLLQTPKAFKPQLQNLFVRNFCSNVC